MLRALCCWLWLVGLNGVVTAAPATDPNIIPVYIRDDVLEDYEKFVAGRNVLTITSFKNINMRRDVADMVLLQQALAIGGFHKRFQYMPGKFNFRNTKMLETGDLLLSFDSYWLSDAQLLGPNVFVSEPVIRRGEYLAALYTSPKNTAALAIRSYNDLQKFTAVSTPKWLTDWRTLEKLPLKQLIREDEWLSQARMVHMQWVDFMLMPFSNTKDGSYQLEQIRMQQIANVAMLLDDSRHFVVSRAHPQGQTAFAALNRGLKEMRAQGRIEKLYKDAGFLVDTSSLIILNAQANSPAQPK